MDNAKNFAKASVSTGYDASATSIVLASGGGAKMPTPPFNVTWWNSTDYPDPSDDPNVEIVRVTAIASETLTVTRAQEGTSATTKNASGKMYKLIAGLTAKTINQDILSSGSASPGASGRLTLQSGTAISTVDQVAAATIYFTPHNGNSIALYNGTVWQSQTFSELSLTLSGLTADKNYDVFLYDNAGTPALEISAAWASDIARADALAVQDGHYVKSGATTRRYVGTFRATSATTTEDSILKRLVWNAHNRVPRDMYVTSGTSHSYNGDFRQWNADTANQIVFVTGLAEDATAASCSGSMGGPTYGAVAIGLDSATAPYRLIQAYVTAAGGPAVGGVIAPQLGYHVLYALESSFSTGAVTFAAFTIHAQIRC